MNQADAGDLDFLTARTHGRMSRLADEGRLDSLCRCAGIAAFAHQVAPEMSGASSKELQCRLMEDLGTEVLDFAAGVDPPGARLLQWLVVRFYVENLKTVARGLLAGKSAATLRDQLILLPPTFTADVQALASVGSMSELLKLLPKDQSEKPVTVVSTPGHGTEKGFVVEANLDQGYLTELLTRTRAPNKEDRNLLLPLAQQEADAFHLMVAIRGRHTHGLEAATLLPCHISGTLISRHRFSLMLSAEKMQDAARLAIGRAIDALPLATSTANDEPSRIEALTRSRFLHLANRVYRRSHLGLAAVVAYAEIRRIEVANLTTVAEGLRIRASREEIRSHLVHPGKEARHV